MPHEVKPPKIALEVRFAGAATPSRVAATARFIERVLAAADPDLPADSVTMVVSNYSTVAGIRAWTPAGNEALRKCERTLRSPSREVVRDPGARRLVSAIAVASTDMVAFGARVAKPRAKKSLAVINENFVERLGKLATPPTATKGVEVPIAGATQVYSPIYRVGRTDEGKEVRARIRVDDRPYDLPIEDAAVAAAFDVAKTGAIVPINIDGGWTRDASNALVIDATRSRITHVGADWKPIAGRDFLDAIHAALPDAFADLDDVLLGDAN